MLTAIATLALAAQGGQAKDLPLTMNEIKRRMTVPVFIVANAADQPLTATGKDGKLYVNVFFGKKESDSFVEAVKKDKKITNVNTRVMSLADVMSINAEKWFVPMESELKNATDFLRKADPKAPEFAQTPLFYLEAKTGYVTVTQAGKLAIPFFFALKGAETLQKKALESKVENPVIKVTSFEQVYSTLRNAPASQTEQIQFVVHPDAIDQYRLMKPDSGGGGG